ncbi:MAG TPA: MurR/RpiR family transcriptional regulator [Streptosporangiaceae bacterium]|nr:MurR/RpiR family transcriptional regulator [Streptosporangiaceae bacterium]
MAPPAEPGEAALSAASDADVTVAERLQLKLAELTPAERKVARALMAEYPVRGLQPVAKLAATAGVSAPTVVRLVSKLSFDSYAGFQRSLKSEVSARLSSPLTMHAGRSAADGDALSRSEQLFCEGIRASFARLPRAEFEQVVRLLAEQRRGVTLIGGRFSSALAEYLAAHLRVLRPNVHVISATGADRTSALLDIGRRDVLVAFDYRRYQHDTVRAAVIAKEQGATLIAFTDPYLSPLAAHADVILTSSVQSPSPFDALTPAVALVEAVVAALVDRLDDRPLARMARYDALYAGTVDEANEEEA